MCESSAGKTEIESIDMAGAREIKNRIKSIQDTMKITRAMYMMSSMKVRKARQKLENTEPYFESLQEQISEILYHFPEMEHLYFDNRSEDQEETVKKKGYIIVTGDKGMAGAYNHNVIKEAERVISDAKDCRLFVLGEVGRSHFRSRKLPVEEDFHYSTSNPSIHRARVITELMVELYQKEELDEIYIIYTRMVNSLKEEVEVKRLLPLKTHDFIEQERLEEARKNQMADKQDLGEEYGLQEYDTGEYIIYPSPKQLLDNIVYNYVTGFLYGVLVEAFASEESARMMAMQSATDNADAMLHELSIEYNRVRQAAITQEITEVIGGAKALKKKKKKQVR